ncbi:hypothetical protein OIU85_000315 [Salix viminalis]|uniref:Uncharacterized protein n=1 Tax=Salix viminalis TaxID=40686 RepID=A0A9Q0ZWN4_SALVM|nr:hypothetical protein OIU85_000315 [Salix viminalis]
MGDGFGKWSNLVMSTIDEWLQMTGTILTLNSGILRWNPFQLSKVVLSYKLFMSTKLVVKWTIFHGREVVADLHMRSFVEDVGSNTTINSAICSGGIFGVSSKTKATQFSHPSRESFNIVHAPPIKALKRYLSKTRKPSLRCPSIF